MKNLKYKIIAVLLASTIIAGSYASFAAITVPVYSPQKEVKSLKTSGKDELGNYTFTTYDYTPVESAQYQFEDMEVGAKDRSTDLIIQDYKGQDVAKDVRQDRPFDLRVDLVKGVTYKLTIKDYFSRESCSVIITKVKAISGETTFIENEKKSWMFVGKWNQVLKFTSTVDGAKTIYLKFANAKSKDIDLSRSMTVSIYDDSWKKVGANYTQYVNSSDKTINIQLPKGEYYFKINMKIESVDDVASLAVDEAVFMNAGYIFKEKLGGYDLITSGLFTPTITGDYVFGGSDRISRIVVGEDDKNLSLKSSRSLKLKLVAGNTYNVYFFTFPSEKNQIEYGVAMAAPIVRLQSNGKNIEANGFSKGPVKVEIGATNLLSRTIKLSGKAVKWPTTNIFKDDGRYEVITMDLLRNFHSTYFVIDSKSPVISVKNKVGQSIKSGTTSKGDVTIAVRESNLYKKTIRMNSKAISWPKTGKVTKAGKYEIIAIDLAGNLSGFVFTIER